MGWDFSESFHREQHGHSHCEVQGATTMAKPFFSPFCLNEGVSIKVLKLGKIEKKLRCINEKPLCVTSCLLSN